MEVPIMDMTPDGHYSMMMSLGVKKIGYHWAAAIELATTLDGTCFDFEEVLGYRVRITHPSWKNNMKLSVIVPMHANINANTMSEIVYEAALLHGDRVVCDAELGYDDIKTLGSIEEVMDEVSRIHDMMQTESDAM